MAKKIATAGKTGSKLLGGSPHFKTWRAYANFQGAVRNDNRYFRSAEEEAFLKTVLQTSKARQTVIRRDKLLWRAQLGNDWELGNDGAGEVARPYPPKRMLPLADSASEGRTNPKGIPYLYLASDRDTALAEVRPWIASLISVGTFKTLRDLRVVNCTNDRRRDRLVFKAPSRAEWEAIVWEEINRAFSVPVTPSDVVADYVPTQIIAELFKHAGLDGVAYKSRLGNGINITLFDLDVVELLNCALCQATALTFEFGEVGNAYYMQKSGKREERP